MKKLTFKQRAFKELGFVDSNYDGSGAMSRTWDNYPVVTAVTVMPSTTLMQVGNLIFKSAYELGYEQAQRDIRKQLGIKDT